MKYCSSLNTGSLYDQQDCDGSQPTFGNDSDDNHPFQFQIPTSGGYQFSEKPFDLGSRRPDTPTSMCSRVEGICSDAELCPFGKQSGAPTTNARATEKCRGFFEYGSEARKVHECSDICGTCCAGPGEEKPIHFMRLVGGATQYEGRLEASVLSPMSILRYRGRSSRPYTPALYPL